MKPRIGFKVTTKDRFSRIIDVPNNRVKYHLDRYAIPKPNCGPLCVFYTLEDASRFIALESKARIYRCRYFPSNRRVVWRRSPLFQRRSSRPLTKLPKGTILATKVRLLNQVKRMPSNLISP
jgi:hypothetical protein